MAKLSSYRLWLACFAVAVAVSAAGATQFIVGGANGWSVPAAGAESFNTWAERTRFQVGDSLVFVYPKDEDSVLLVDPSDYNACNTSSYVQRFDDGDTVYALDRPGALFFISGVDASCRAGEKLIVMVLAAARNATGGSGGGAPPAPTIPAPPPASPSPPSPPASSAAPPPPPPPATSASAPPTASASTTPPPPPAPRASSPAEAPASPAPPPPAAADAPPAPGARSPAPSANGTTTANSTGTPPSRPAGSKQKNGAGVAVATGLASSLGACVFGYAMLAL